MTILLIIVVTLFAALCYVCIILFRQLQQDGRAESSGMAHFREERDYAIMQRDHTISVLTSYSHSAAKVMSFLAGEVERVTGCSADARVLERIANNMHQYPRPLNDPFLAQEMRSEGFTVPDRPIHVGDALEFAMAVNEKVMRSERDLCRVTRMGEICPPGHQWVAEMLARYQRFCNDDAAKARKSLRLVLDYWEFQHSGDRHVEVPPGIFSIQE